MILHPYLVQLSVDGKTLMIDYEERLVNLVISTFYFNYGLLWLRVDDKTLIMDYEGDSLSLMSHILYFNYGYLWLSGDVILKYVLY